MWAAILTVDVLAGALLLGMTALLGLAVIGASLPVLVVGVVAGVLAGGYYGRVLAKRLRRSTRQP